MNDTPGNTELWKTAFSWGGIVGAAALGFLAQFLGRKAGPAPAPPPAVDPRAIVGPAIAGGAAKMFGNEDTTQRKTLEKILARLVSIDGHLTAVLDHLQVVQADRLKRIEEQEKQDLRDEINELKKNLPGVPAELIERLRAIVTAEQNEGHSHPQSE